VFPVRTKMIIGDNLLEQISYLFCLGMIYITKH
jgi:hypothetical protein